MTRRSSRLQKRCENGPFKKCKATKQSNRTKVPPLSKLQCDKNQLLLDVSAPRVLIKTQEKGARDDSIPSPPRPHLRWGSSEDVWEKTVGKEQNYRHSKSFMQKHPRIHPRMRSILLDWLLEVSEAYALHRQTFYLAQDYFDRFMLTQNDFEKGMLQLTGITCLFIASKMEEACPPKLSQLAYETDGTCYEQQILQMECIILKALCWNLCPETAVSWLKLYFQRASMNSDLSEPQLSQDTYVQMTQLLDLCTLNINSLDFQYQELAAAVLCHFVQQETVEKLSGLSTDVLQPCVHWMALSAAATVQFGSITPRNFTGIKSEERQNIQSYSNYMTMVDWISQQEANRQFPTPPNSTEKTGDKAPDVSKTDGTQSVVVRSVTEH